MTTEIEIIPGANSLSDWRQVYRDNVSIKLSRQASEAIKASADFITDIVASGQVAYGVNTGFGTLANRQLESEDLETLQRNLVLSHTVGVGDLLPASVVRLILALKVAAFARGASGVRPEVVQLMVEMLRRGLIPRIPSQGSVGASGDLVPLAHLSSTLIGEGLALFRGEELPAADALRRAELSPVELGPKEGLALLNGTQVSTALALAGLFEIERVFQTALVTGAMTTDALLGSEVPFRPEIQALRPHQGQVDVARALLALLEGSPLRALQRKEGRLQDPYCLRCQPQVLGACLDNMSSAALTLEVEAVSVTDNPLILTDKKEILSGGNFHAEPVSFAADILAISVAEIGSLAERRITMLTDESISGLPPFLTEKPGLNSGLMSLQIAAASLVSENRQRAHPASVDNVPTVANYEDHVSMATHGARRLLEMARNAASILAYELLIATEGLDYQLPTQSSDRLEAVRALVRSKVDSMSLDRRFEPEIAKANEMVRSGAVVSAAGRNSIPSI